MLDLRLGAFRANETEHAAFVRKDQDFQNRERKAHKHESKHLTTVERSKEAFFNVNVAEVSYFNVGGSCDPHTDVASNH